MNVNCNTTRLELSHRHRFAVGAPSVIERADPHSPDRRNLDFAPSLKGVRLNGLSSTFWLAVAALCQALAEVALVGSTTFTNIAKDARRRASR